MGAVIGIDCGSDRLATGENSRHGSGSFGITEAARRQAWAQTSLWQEKALAKRA
jgi:hypothetical protein